MSAQASDVIEALIREYLTKRGLVKSLSAFNEEQPKTERSVNKCEALRQCLSIERVAAKYKQNHPEKSSLPPTLELWVTYQMSKASGNFVETPQPPKAASRPAMRSAMVEDDPEEVSMPEAVVMGGSQRRSAGRMPSALRTSPTPASTSSPPAPRTAPVTPPKPTGAFASPSSPGVADRPLMSPSRTSSGGEARRVSGTGAVSSPVPANTGAPRPTRASHGSHGSSDGSSRDDDSGRSSAHRAAPPPSRTQGMVLGPPRATDSPPAGAAPPPPRPALGRLPAAPLASRTTTGARQDRMVMEDIDDFEDDVPLEAPVRPGGLLSQRASPGMAVRGGPAGQPVSPDTVRQLRVLLWGSLNAPPPSWKQGFFFCNKRGLEFGLVQKEGGPCGILAGVQAHVLSALRPAGSSTFMLSPADHLQRQALVTSFANILWQARGGQSAVLVLPSADHGVPSSSLGYSQLGSALSMYTLPTLEALQDLLRSSLAVLMQPDGWGIIFFLFALVLTRGISSVQGDMDEASTTLMASHGYCTMELVNLILIGRATSNLFDGEQDFGGMKLRGIKRQSKFGLLTLYEWYKNFTVGGYYKNPELPIWVINSESHFTTLFAADDRPLRDKLPFDLYFYDELAKQDSLIKLSVKKDPAGGWTHKVGDKANDRGRCGNENIPPLECCIETRWPGVAVDWNGAEPIL